MKTLLPFILFITFVIGCGTPSNQVWYQPGKTPAEAWTDYNDCKLVAAKTADPYGIGNFRPALIGPNTPKHRQREYLEAGMRARGYDAVASSQTSASGTYPPTK